MTVVGDACHPMSMFKGQGANQALEDAPLLASWLDKPWLNEKSLPTILRSFEREMLARSLPKVSMSRTAAISLHSAHHGELDACSHFEGVKECETEMLLNGLRERGVNVLRFGDNARVLEEHVRAVIAEMQVHSS